MTEQSPAVTAAHPPAAVIKIVNPLLGLLLKTPLAGSARSQMMVLNVKGRKSGRQYSIPLSAHVVDGVLYAVTAAAWKNNFRDGATAEILHEGKTTTVHGELITDQAVVADLEHRIATKYGAKRAQRSMGLKFRDGTVPTLEQFAEVVGREHIVAIRLTPAA